MCSCIQRNLKTPTHASAHARSHQYTILGYDLHLKHCKIVTDLAQIPIATPAIRHDGPRRDLPLAPVAKSAARLVREQRMAFRTGRNLTTTKSHAHTYTQEIVTLINIHKYKLTYTVHTYKQTRLRQYRHKLAHSPPSSKISRATKKRNNEHDKTTFHKCTNDKRARTRKPPTHTTTHTDTHTHTRICK